MPSDQQAALPRVVLAEPEEDELVRVLAEGQFLLLKYPVAAQAAFSALVAEGRRFAATPEGRRWRARLRESALVRCGRALWEGSVLNMLEHPPETPLPSMLLDAIVGATASGDVATLLGRLFGDAGDGGGAGDP